MSIHSILARRSTTGHKKKHFTVNSDELQQVAQRGCAVSVLGEQTCFKT